MTGLMRRNLELYGGYISMDFCKRGLHDVSWPYVAVTASNEFNRVVVCMEGILLVEGFDAYKFLIQNLFDMCPGRKHNEYRCVAGDGFFDQDMIQRLGFPAAKYIHDNWHLRESIKCQFGVLIGTVTPMIKAVIKQRVRGCI